MNSHSRIGKSVEAGPFEFNLFLTLFSILTDGVECDKADELVAAEAAAYESAIPY